MTKVDLYMKMLRDAHEMDLMGNHTGAMALEDDMDELWYSMSLAEQYEATQRTSDEWE